MYYFIVVVSVVESCITASSRRLRADPPEGVPDARLPSSLLLAPLLGGGGGTCARPAGRLAFGFPCASQVDDAMLASIFLFRGASLHMSTHSR